MRLRSKILLWFLPLLIAAFLLTGWFAVVTQFINNRDNITDEFGRLLQISTERFEQQKSFGEQTLALLTQKAELLSTVSADAEITVLSAPDPRFTAAQWQQLQAGYSVFSPAEAEHHVAMWLMRTLPGANTGTDALVSATENPPQYLLLKRTVDLNVNSQRFDSLSPKQIMLVDDRGQLIVGFPQQVDLGLISQGLELLRQEDSHNVIQGEARGSDGSYWLSVAMVEQGVYAIAALPKAVAYKQLMVDSVNVLMVALLTCGLAGLVLFRSLNSLVIEPIERMRDASLAMASGQMDFRVASDRQDELGELERSFENMSMSLQTFAMEMQSMAYQDKLTGLPNRRRFQENLRDAVVHAARHNEKMALLFIDLDGFKQVNDTFGHDMGDRLLEQVARRLRSCLRETDQLAVAISERELLADVLAQTGSFDSGDVGGFGEEGASEEAHTLARLGGDEFTILLTRLEAGMDAALVAERVLQAFDEPCKVGTQSFHIGASIGIACYPDDGHSADELTKHADTAMYEAKNTGKHRYQFFDAAMGQANARRMELTTELRRSLEEKHFALYYQPLVSAISGKIYGYEALLRWLHPEKGMISPGEFIPVAEESGLILPLGEWVLFEACRQAMQWQNDGYEPCVTSVNISNIQVNRGQLSDMIREALNSSGLEPRYLLIELTESAIMDASAEVIADLHAIRAMGVRVAIDDFGTGYSSLGALKQLPIDVLKIDRSFVDGLARDEKSGAIVAAILAMGNKLGLKLVAEGIESEEQMHLLSLNGCHIYQGFAISRPLPAEQVPEFIQGGYELEV